MFEPTPLARMWLAPALVSVCCNHRTGASFVLTESGKEEILPTLPLFISLLRPIMMLSLTRKSPYQLDVAMKSPGVEKSVFYWYNLQSKHISELHYDQRSIGIVKRAPPLEV